MSSSHIRTLLNPPSLQASREKAKEEINLRFSTIDDLADLDLLVPELKARRDEFKKKVLSRIQYLPCFTANPGSAIHVSNSFGWLREPDTDDHRKPLEYCERIISSAAFP